MQSIRIRLGVPRHGWLPFDINIGDYSFSDEASDLGLNLIDQIIEMLNKVQVGKEAECYFYLEPSAYFLKMSPSAETSVISVQFVHDFDTKDILPETLFQTKIKTNEFLNAAIEALKDFRNHKFDKDDWPTPDRNEILKEL